MGKKMKKEMPKNDFSEFEESDDFDIGDDNQILIDSEKLEIEKEEQFLKETTVSLACALATRSDTFISNEYSMNQLAERARLLAETVNEEIKMGRSARDHLRSRERDGKKDILNDEE